MFTLWFTICVCACVAKVDCSATGNCQTAKPPDMNFITNHNSKLGFLIFLLQNFFSKQNLIEHLFIPNVYIGMNLQWYDSAR